MSIDKATPSDWYKIQQLEPGEFRQAHTLQDIISAASRQHGGNHYKGTKIQSWDVFLDWGLDPWACNVIKYVQRHRKKAGKDDLEKAKHYLEFMIENYDAVGDKYYKT